MAFRWSIDLSTSHIALLMAFYEWDAAGNSPNLTRDEGDRPGPMAVYATHTGMVGRLLKERLIYHREVKISEKPPLAEQYWGITEKGKAIVAAIRYDAEKLKTGHELEYLHPNKTAVLAGPTKQGNGNTKRKRRR